MRIAETSPAEALARNRISVVAPRSVTRDPPLDRSDRLGHVDALPQHRPEGILHLFESLGDRPDREVRRVEPRVHLVPPKRTRGGSAGERPHRIRRHDRVAMSVLAEVDVLLPPPPP